MLGIGRMFLRGRIKSTKQSLLYIMSPELSSQQSENYRDKYHISVDILFDDFKNHLKIQDNLRIFFSGKFGSGKSYFLHEFFNYTLNEYEVIKLYPVNYSTANNNDIFELIKFDILFHLMRLHEKIIDTSPITDLIKLQWYIRDVFSLNKVESNLTILSSLASLTEGNDVVKKVLPSILNLYETAKKGYKKYAEELKNDDRDIVDNFLMNILKNNPEYGDEEPITKIIINTINKIKKSGKKTVLLIDDMDRLDPNHLFRILNVFGNHFDSSSGNKFYINENKFGFDKVILVGDVDNIQSIFEHRYGKTAHFEGYFSKYYSKQIYFFDLKKIFVGNALVNKTDIIFRDNLLPHYSRLDGKLDSFTIGLINLLKSYFLEENQITFRHINQKRNLNVPLANNRSTNNFPTPVCFKVSEYFIHYFEGKDNLISTLNKCKDFSITKSPYHRQYYETFYKELVLFNFHDLYNSFEYNEIKKNETKTYRNQLTILDGDSRGVSYKIHLDIINPPTINFIHISPKYHDVLETPDISFKKLYIQFLQKYY